MRYLHTLNTFFNRIISSILIVIFGAMVVIIFAQVIFRYALNLPLAWSEELARYLFIWATFFGASIAFYNDTHIRMGSFVDAIANVRCRGALLLIADLFTMSFLAMYVWSGFDVSSRILMTTQAATSMEWLPIGAVYLGIPIGSLFMLLNVLNYALRHAKMIQTGMLPDDTGTSAH